MPILLLLLFCSLLPAEQADPPCFYYPVTSYRVVDGDTIEVTLMLGFDLYKVSKVRLLGVDAPELTGGEAAAGRAAKLFVENFLKDRKIRCRWLGDDKYGGRFIGAVYADGENLSTALLNGGHAREYDTKFND